MRIPYVPNPPPASSPDDAAIVARIEARRAPRPLQPLDLALLHSPPVADGWNAFLGAVRTRTTIADDVRELAISRVAVVNRAWYEWAHHAPLAVAAGVPQTAMDALKTDGAALALDERPGAFTERQWAALVIADEMTRAVEVSDATFERVKGFFSERETVEIVATVACYNCVSRFLVALDGELSMRAAPPCSSTVLGVRYNVWTLTRRYSRREERHRARWCALSPICEASTRKLKWDVEAVCGESAVLGCIWTPTTKLCGNYITSFTTLVHMELNNVTWVEKNVLPSSIRLSFHL